MKTKSKKAKSNVIQFPNHDPLSLVAIPEGISADDVFTLVARGLRLMIS